MNRTRCSEKRSYFEESRRKCLCFELVCAAGVEPTTSGFGGWPTTVYVKFQGAVWAIICNGKTMWTRHSSTVVFDRLPIWLPIVENINYSPSLSSSTACLITHADDFDRWNLSDVLLNDLANQLGERLLVRSSSAKFIKHRIAELLLTFRRLTSHRRVLTRRQPVDWVRSVDIWFQINHRVARLPPWSGTPKWEWCLVVLHSALLRL